MAIQAQKTFRQQIRFWLDRFREDENELADYVDELKQNRSFASTMRDALRLIRDLRKGQVGTLLQLFPWIEEHFKNQHNLSEVTLTQPAEITHQLNELKQLLLVSGAPSKQIEAAASSALNISETPLEIEVTQRLIGEEYDLMPSWNLPIQIAASTGNYASLTPEMIWYGIRTGLINAEKALKAGQLQPGVIADGVEEGKLDAAKLPKELRSHAPPTTTNKGPKTIEGADITLSEPDLDDLELDF